MKYYYKDDMYKFVNSDEFKNKNVKKQKNEFIDLKTDIVYATIVSKLKDIDKLEYDNPVILLSDNGGILNVIGMQFDVNRWTADKVNNLSGLAFDYIYRLQYERYKRFKKNIDAKDIKFGYTIG